MSDPLIPKKNPFADPSVPQRETLLDWMIKHGNEPCATENVPVTYRSGTCGHGLGDHMVAEPHRCVICPCKGFTTADKGFIIPWEGKINMEGRALKVKRVPIRKPDSDR